MNISRRGFLQSTAVAAVSAPQFVSAQSGPHVVIVGGGFGGVTAAKYLRRFNPAIRVTLIEPSNELISCAMSIRVIRGDFRLGTISRSYAPFALKQGIKWIPALVDDIDSAGKRVIVGRERIQYDTLIVSPGVDFHYDKIPGLETEQAQAAVPHAWKAGKQILQMRDMLSAMPQGGVFAMHIPKGEMRHRPAAYERASLIADLFKRRNPTAKVLVFDSNSEPSHAKGLVLNDWKNRFGGMVEYVPNAEIERVEAATSTITLKGSGAHKADVLNVIPPQSAGAIARKAGLANVDRQWCGVEHLSFESTQHKGIHVLGDATVSIPGTSKSGQLANQEAKVCAAAVAARSLGQPVNPAPLMIAAEYAFFSQSEALNSVQILRYDAAKKAMVAVKEGSGVSPVPTSKIGLYGISWATNIFTDMMG